MPAHSYIKGLSDATKAGLSHFSPFPGPGSIGIVLIVVSGVDVGVDELVGGVDVGAVVVGVVVVLGVVVVVGVVVVGVAVTVVVTGVTVAVRGAGCWGRGCATGTSRGEGITTTVEVSATGATTG
jgi:hypothetical protein